MRRAAAFIPVLVLAIMAAGCASRSAPGPVEVAAGGYPAAFDAARESLREARFQLDRIDAAAGVITTRAKPTGGVMTPWDGEQSTARQEWDDMLNQQSRVVRVQFLPADLAAGELMDLREYDGPVRADIQVVVLRTARPGWRVQTRSVTSSRFTRDPAAIERGIGYDYDVPETRDPDLGARLAAAMRERIAKENAAPHEAASNR